MDVHLENIPVKNENDVTSALKVFFAALGPIGTALDEALFEGRARIKQKRVTNFFEMLVSGIDGRDLADFDPKSLQREDFSDVLEEISISISKTSAKHKIEIFKKIVLIEMEGANDINQTFKFISIANHISANQYSILKRFSFVSSKLIALETQIEHSEKELPNFLKKVKQEKEHHNNGKANNFSKYKQELDDLNHRIASMKETHEALPKINDPQYHMLPDIEYIIEIQDLVSRGLIVDLGVGKRDFVAFSVCGITELGNAFIKYVDGK